MAITLASPKHEVNKKRFSTMRLFPGQFPNFCSVPRKILGYFQLFLTASGHPGFKCTTQYKHTIVEKHIYTRAGVMDMSGHTYKYFESDEATGTTLLQTISNNGRNVK